MIVRDDSERGIPPLVTHQPPSSLDDAPVIRGRMVQIPGWIIPLYAGLFIALGWFGGEQWRHPAPPQTLPLPVAHAALLPLTAAGEAAPKTPPPAAKASAPAAPEVDSDTLPPLRYSAHVYASRPEKRSIVLNGKAWTEDGGRFTPAEPGGGADPAGCDDLQLQRHDLYPRGAGGLAGRKN
nr:type II secretion system assembly factor GspB [Klebsiella pneumoniae]